jgi:hypothetical protein
MGADLAGVKARHVRSGGRGTGLVRGYDHRGRGDGARRPRSGRAKAGI